MNLKNESDANCRALAYAIVEFSSQDAEYPAEQLASVASPPKGWQTQRYAYFPQFIVVKFPHPSYVHHFKMLSHQSKIASKIEVFVSKPEDGNLVPNFQKLGFFPLSSNEGSAFQSREIKIVQIGLPLSFVKLVLHQPHTNPLNFFNQAGIIALTFLGYELLSNEPQTLGQNYYNARKVNDAQLGSVMPKEVAVQIQRLEEAKATAVAHEDFTAAKKLKEEIDKIKSRFSELVILEQEKKAAIEKEDYDRAMALKAQIEKLKVNLHFGLDANPQQVARSKWQQAPGHPARAYQPPSPKAGPVFMQKGAETETYDTRKSHDASMYSQRAQELELPHPLNTNRSLYIAKRTDNGPQEHFNRQIHFEPSHQNLNQGLSVIETPNPHIIYMTKGSHTESGNLLAKGVESPSHTRSRSLRRRNFVEIDYLTSQKLPSPKSIQDDRPLPTLINKQEPRLPVDAEPALAENPGQNPTDPKENGITEKNQYKIDQLDHVFCRSYLVELFGNSFSLKVKAVERLLDYLQAFAPSEAPNAREIFATQEPLTSLIGAIKVALALYEERSPQLVHLSLQMFSAALSLLSTKGLTPAFKASGESEMAISEFLNTSADKVADYKNASLLTAVMDILTSIHENSFEPFDAVMDHFISKRTTRVKNESFKHLIGKLKVVRKLFGSAPHFDEKIYQKMIHNAAEMLENANKEVRDEARELIVDIAKVFGEDKVLKSLDGLRVRRSTMDEVIKRFPKPKDQPVTKELRAAEPPPVKQAQPSKPQLERDVGPQQQQALAQEERKSPALSNDNESLKVCHFCKKADQSFSDIDKFDYHLWKECPMLTSCAECLQIIEVADYNAHLLTECKSMNQYTKCALCQQAISGEVYEQHVSRSECKPLDANANLVRCPMCFTDLKVNSGDLEEAWRQHLVGQTCSRSQRR